MADIIRYSKKAYIKLIGGLFRDVSGRNWMITTISWLIDSKTRQYKRLDSFLKEQLNNPDPLLVKKANEFKKYRYDKRIVEILKFVYKTVRYMHDQDNFGTNEKWATAIETLTRKKDDCDGINNLIYILGRLSGIPAFMLYCAIGDTHLGGHFWTMYFSTKKGVLYPIDGTYYVDLKEIRYRAPFRLRDTRYRKVWYLFNDQFTFRQK